MYHFYRVVNSTADIRNSQHSLLLSGPGPAPSLLPRVIFSDQPVFQINIPESKCISKFNRAALTSILQDQDFFMFYNHDLRIRRVCLFSSIWWLFVIPNLFITIA